MLPMVFKEKNSELRNRLILLIKYIIFKLHTITISRRFVSCGVDKGKTSSRYISSERAI